MPVKRWGGEKPLKRPISTATTDRPKSFRQDKDFEFPMFSDCVLEPVTAEHSVCNCPVLMNLWARYLGGYYLTSEDQI